MLQDALVNPALLVWARKSINMDVDAAAQKIRVKPDRLRQWERGERRPTINQARKMSSVYRRPLAAFYLPEPPGSLGFSVPHDFRRLPSDEPRALSPELITELRRAEYLREVAINIAEVIPEAPKGFVGLSRTDEAPETLARRAEALLDVTMEDRTGWRTEYDALNAWKDAIETQGVLVMHLNGVGVDEVRGVAIAEEAFPLIAVNGKDSPNGRVFTLMHEFVHLMVGVTGISNLRLGLHARSSEQLVEQFCNAVGAEALVPRNTLLTHEAVKGASGPAAWPDDVISDLGRYFRVSREVVVRRLLTVGLVTREFYRQKRRQYQEEWEASGTVRSGRMPMSRKIIRAIGQPFARIAIGAYYRDAISSSELAEFLGARLKHLPAVEDLLGGRNVLTGGDR